jgi:hypothetical protein
MSKKILFTKDQILQKRKELKEKEKQYNQVVDNKPNPKVDDLASIIDWVKDILIVMKK